MRQGRSLFHRRAMHGLVLLCVLAPCVAGAAPKVYRCAAGAGPVVYQDRPCADPARQQQIEFVPSPFVEATADTTAHAKPRKASASRVPKRKSKSPAEVMSWECRAANGEVFYRHSRCPGSIPASTPSRRGSRGAASGIGVRASPLPRREACRRIRAGAPGGRAGRERDETVTTYERNLGRDPCRRF